MLAAGSLGATAESAAHLSALTSSTGLLFDLLRPVKSDVLRVGRAVRWTESLRCAVEETMADGAKNNNARELAATAAISGECAARRPCRA
jgi:hypothetical protein